MFLEEEARGYTRDPRLREELAGENRNPRVSSPERVGRGTLYDLCDLGADRSEIAYAKKLEQAAFSHLARDRCNDRSEGPARLNRDRRECGVWRRMIISLAISNRYPSLILPERRLGRSTTELTTRSPIPEHAAFLHRHRIASQQ
jgi:hypothetical protein